jgi:hypothetical protein
MARKVVDDLGLEAEFEKVTEMSEIMKWPILSTRGWLSTIKLSLRPHPLRSGNRRLVKE